MEIELSNYPDIRVIVKDANGNLLADGDTVVVLKNLKVKGANGPVKAGTKVKNIRFILKLND